MSVSPGGFTQWPGTFLSNGTHFEPQLASVRAGRLEITCKSGPHASALRLKIYNVSAIDLSVCRSTKSIRFTFGTSRLCFASESTDKKSFLTRTRVAPVALN